LKEVIIEMATVKPPEVDWEELFEEIENKYPINNEPFVTYGLYEDLESLADNNESGDLSKILIR